MKDYERVAVTHRIIAVLWGISWLGSIYRIFSPTVGQSSWQWAAISVILLTGLSGHILLAVGASAAKPWARSGSLVAAVLYVLCFPLGTFAALRLYLDAKEQWQPTKKRQSLADAWPMSTP
jgi:hypothetical protein